MQEHISWIYLACKHTWKNLLLFEIFFAVSKFKHNKMGFLSAPLLLETIFPKKFTEDHHNFWKCIWKWVLSLFKNSANLYPIKNTISFKKFSSNDNIDLARKKISIYCNVIIFWKVNVSELHSKKIRRHKKYNELLEAFRNWKTAPKGLERWGEACVAIWRTIVT